ncbi:hypothetical protein AQUCO_03700027v1 [Aquilegia coerulea]|uniref:Uncharacterized protein n=1 Tax=Aquilegia coerulea TaxID=218851 RepID=A0A2G5CT67_AQUCA|nr:hypothetical protein AQUCO_03700027v1 [Aquilegia coerulea]
MGGLFVVRQVLAKLVLLVVILTLLGSACAAKCKYQAIFNFGDSNSDTGGFFAAFPSQPKPYGMTYFKRPSGRAADGRLIIDFMAQAFGLPFISPYLQSIGSNYRHGVNYATLASTVLLPNTSLFVSGISPFYLDIQLNQMKAFKARVLEDGPSEILPSPRIFRRSLYTIYIGQNDFTSNLASIGLSGVKQYLPDVVAHIAGTVKELYNLGGRTFLVFNLGPVGCYPGFLAQLPHQSSDLDEYGCMTQYNNVVEVYNGMLKDALLQTRKALPHASIIYVDINSVYLDLFRRPKEHGLMYGTKACCGTGGGDYNFDPQVFCGTTKLISGKSVTAQACNDPQNYVSWDGIHATEAANKLITSAILNGSLFDPPFPLNKLCRLRSIG